MPDEAITVLRRWAAGDFDPFTSDADGRDGFDELAKQVEPDVEAWWHAFRTLFNEYGKEEAARLELPFEVLLQVGGERLHEEVAAAARDEPRIASAFWNAMDDLSLEAEAYHLLGRKLTREAFIRHAPRIPSRGELWPPEWEDEWSAIAIWYLTDQDPDEAWALALELLDVSGNLDWVVIVGTFIIEELLKEHGDAFIERIETEAAQKERLRMALPSTRWAVPEHLVARVQAAAGPYWRQESLGQR